MLLSEIGRKPGKPRFLEPRGWGWVWRPRGLAAGPIAGAIEEFPVFPDIQAPLVANVGKLLLGNRAVLQPESYVGELVSAVVRLAVGSDKARVAVLNAGPVDFFVGDLELAI